MLRFLSLHSLDIVSIFEGSESVPEIARQRKDVRKIRPQGGVFRTLRCTRRSKLQCAKECPFSSARLTRWGKQFRKNRSFQDGTLAESSVHRLCAPALPRERHSGLLRAATRAVLRLEVFGRQLLPGASGWVQRADSHDAVLLWRFLRSGAWGRLLSGLLAALQRHRAERYVATRGDKKCVFTVCI